MELQLGLSKSGQINLAILDRRGRFSKTSWKDRAYFSGRLLKEIDALMKKARISLDKVSGYRIMGDVPKNWTTYRIAKITFETLALARPCQKKSAVLDLNNEI